MVGMGPLLPVGGSDVLRLTRALLVAALLAAGCSDGDAEADPPISAIAPVSEPSSTATLPATTTSTTTPTTTAAVEEQPSVATIRSGDRTCTTHDGLERCWLTHVPPTLTAPAPLVIDFHGWTSNARTQRSFSGFEELANQEDFVVVWPEGHGSSFNAGGICCPPASSDAIDDVGFTRLLVSIAAADGRIDLDRVYVTGLSNGCGMAQRLAADASDLVAAVACMALYRLDEADPGYTPVPVMELHGTNDIVVAYEPSVFFTGAEDNWSTWAELNGCTSDPVETWRSGDSYARSYEDCEGGSEVSLVTITGGGHLLYPGAETDVDTTRLAWEFMSRFTN